MISNGIIVCWGKDYNIQSTGSTTYTLAQSYTTSYSIASNLGYNSTGNWRANNYPYSLTLSSFTVNHSVKGTNFSYITIGY